MEGQTIGKYKIVSRVAEGGMGVFYRALDTRLDRTVGIKTLHTEFSVDPQLRERFINEAKALAKLNHPNICVLHDFFEDQDRLFIVMEYIEGETLSDLARRVGAIPSDQLVPLFRQILLALDYAHKKKIIHRDIKPSNIMLSGQGIVKVMDFGIAKIVGSSKQLTMTGRKVGSIPYMSPEQITQKDIDQRSDLYSLGITMYQLSTGRVPFDSTSDFEVMKSHLEAPPPPPREIEPKVPRKLEEIILKSIEKKPEERYQTAQEMREAIAGLGSAAMRDSVPELVEDKTSVITGEFETRKKDQKSKRGLLMGIGAVVVVAAIATAIALVMTGGKPEPPPIVSLPPPDTTTTLDTLASQGGQTLPPPPPETQTEDRSNQTAQTEEQPPEESNESSGPTRHRIVVDVTPSGRFRLDNYGWWHTGGRIAEGPHQLEAMGPGFPIVRKTIYVGRDTNITVNLAAESRDLAEGDLRASAKTSDDKFPPCDIYINGSLEGSVPGFRKQLKAGLYEINIKPETGFRADSVEYLGRVYRQIPARLQVPSGKRSFARFYLTKQ